MNFSIQGENLTLQATLLFNLHVLVYIYMYYYILTVYTYSAHIL